MKLSARDLEINARFIITISTLISNIYPSIWDYIYAVVNLLVLKLFLYLKTNGLLTIDSLVIKSLFLVFMSILVTSPCPESTVEELSLKSWTI
tara:strand:+ start:86 stop:364 length:279 start_codon:yes stop_codon:yes gene_type:complete